MAKATGDAVQHTMQVANTPPPQPAAHIHIHPSHHKHSADGATTTEVADIK